MQKPLMTSRRFAPLFWTQFVAAFNDNFLKNALVFPDEGLRRSRNGSRQDGGDDCAHPHRRP